MNWPIATMALRGDENVVAARRLARTISAALNFDLQDQTRIATTVSEISRNAVSYAGGGQTRFCARWRRASANSVGDRAG